MKKLILLYAVFIFITIEVFSENKSVVTVGNKMIFESDIKANMAGNKEYKESMNELILQKMLVFQAEAEGHQATEEEVADEIKKIKGSFPDEASFLNNLSNQNMSYTLLKAAVADKIKTNKLVKQKIANRIEIRQSEIMNAIRELQSQNNVYCFRLKWFESEEEGMKFAGGFDGTKETEMSEAEWFKQEEILPEVLEEIKKVKEGELTPPFKIKEKYLVLLLKGVKQDDKTDMAELYGRARNLLYQKKFGQQFDAYVKELQSTIPVFYSE
ncbi:MAG TPA: hypothetical protein PKN36_04300 [bacterium]|jgi:parvulin-like peptidyl-prolyl isomerase|nr:hypothetical protein [bacterium]